MFKELDLEKALQLTRKLLEQAAMSDTSASGDNRTFDPSSLKVKEPPVYALSEVYIALDKTQLNADVKTIINCLVEGDLENLKVAQFLLNKRINILSVFK